MASGPSASLTTRPPASRRPATVRPSRRWARPSTRSRTRSQAALIAPPVTYVCREAEVDPAEPTPVSTGLITTCSTPSSVRQICCSIVTRPWPTSAAAVCTVTTGSPAVTSSRTRAVE